MIASPVELLEQLAAAAHGVVLDLDRQLLELAVLRLAGSSGGSGGFGSTAFLPRAAISVIVGGCSDSMAASNSASGTLATRTAWTRWWSERPASAAALV
jgi:hypothetical protein